MHKGIAREVGVQQLEWGGGYTKEQSRGIE